MRTELPYKRQKTPRMRRKAAFGVFCLTTVYPTSTTGVHGNSGDKTAGKDVFPSGKGRKRPEISGNRYSEFLWEQDAASSSPVTPTEEDREGIRLPCLLRLGLSTPILEKAVTPFHGFPSSSCIIAVCGDILTTAADDVRPHTRWSDRTF